MSSHSPATATAPPSSDGLRFFGLFEVLHELELPATQTEDLYDGFHAGLYDVLTGADDFDVPHYLERAQATGGPVLELACGSGRLALPLARAGYEVTGVDIAPDMLRLLRRRLLSEPAEVARRVRPLLADARTIELERPHRLAIIGAMSICLLRAPEDRAAMFAAIRRALAPDARFCLDYLQTSPAALRAQDAEVLALPQRGPRSTRVTLLGRRWIREEGVQLVNFYTEDVDPLGRTRRYLGSTTKAIVDGGELRAQLSESGFEVESEQTTSTLGEGETAEEIRLLTCRPV
jgi:SAM-dependent methyltransferase